MYVLKMIKIYSCIYILKIYSHVLYSSIYTHICISRIFYIHVCISICMCVYLEDIVIYMYAYLENDEDIHVYISWKYIVVFSIYILVCISRIYCLYTRMRIYSDMHVYIFCTYTVTSLWVLCHFIGFPRIVWGRSSTRPLFNYIYVHQDYIRIYMNMYIEVDQVLAHYSLIYIYTRNM